MLLKKLGIVFYGKSIVNTFIVSLAKKVTLFTVSCMQLLCIYLLNNFIKSNLKPKIPGFSSIDSPILFPQEDCGSCSCSEKL